MKRYRKKPVVVEAIQLTTENIKEVYRVAVGNVDLTHRMAENKWFDYEDIVKREGMRLKTPESDGETQGANIGDYIVFGHSKELGKHCWPVKPDYFEGAYEEVTE